MTITEWQRKGMVVLGEKPREICRKEIDYIISGVLGFSLTELYLKTRELVDEEKGRKISLAFEKRLSGTPLQYIFEEVEFFSLPFYVKQGVFIPRPETELLVEEALKVLGASVPVAEGGEAQLVLDLCTGCGNIALSIARNSHAEIIATDISTLSLEVAGINRARLGLTGRVKFLEGDLFEPLGREKNFSLIVSNPPYISTREWDMLPEEVKHFEPRDALFAGEDGLNFYRRISTDAKRFIKKGGYLLLEAGDAFSIISILKGEGWQDIKAIKDYNNYDRIISCRAAR